MEYFIKQLTKVEDELAEYLNPDNKTAMYAIFVDWVVKEWTHGKFYKPRKIEHEGHTVFYPMRTDTALELGAPTYSDFIMSLNGVHHTILPQHKSITEQRRDDLRQMFHRCAVEKLQQLLKEHDVKVPTELQPRFRTAFDVLWTNELIVPGYALLESFHKGFKFRFGTEGTLIELYRERSKFRDMSLEDFKNLHKKLSKI